MKRKSWLFFVCCFGFFSKLAYSQNYPVYTHFYNNAYLYNPAEAGSAMRGFAAVNHRQQWLGVEGAPTVTTLTFHNLVDESRGAYGVKISSFSRGLLNTSDLLLTYTYSVRLQEGLNLNFGLSGGLISNSIDVTNSTYPNDPAIASYLENNLQPAGNFGIKLASNGLNLGLSLPQLFGQAFANESSFDNLSNITPLDNAIAMVYYKKEISGQIRTRKRKGVRRRYKVEGGYAPLELYALYRYSSFRPNQFEVIGKLNLNKFFWFGLGYKQNHGISGNTGLNYKDFTFSYGYDPSFNQVSGLGNGTHEVQLSIQFGRKKRYKITEIEIRSKLLNNGSDKHQARYQGTEDEEIQKQDKDKKDKDKRHIVYLKAFKDFASGDTFSKKLREQGYNANVYYYEKTKKYYVYIFESTKIKDANTEAKNLSRITNYKNAKVLTIEEEED